MANTPSEKTVSAWKCVVVGALVGFLAGIIAGPITIVARMSTVGTLRGPVFMGIELIGEPLFGAVFGTLEGASVGLIWAMCRRRPPQLKLGEFMIGVAISGPLIPMVIVFPLVWTGLFASAVALVTVPALILVEQAITHGS